MPDAVLFEPTKLITGLPLTEAVNMVALVTGVEEVVVVLDFEHEE